MTLVSIVVVLVIVELVMWLINTCILMAGGIKSLLNVVLFTLCSSGSYKDLSSSEIYLECTVPP